MAGNHVTQASGGWYGRWVSFVRPAGIALVVLASAVIATPSHPASATPPLPISVQSAPPGFTDALVVSVGAPTAFAFHPDGRMLVTTQPGRVRIVRNGALLPTPALDLTGVMCGDSERGLLGIALDPNVSTNGFVYLFYTFRKFGGCPANSPQSPVNRVSRFTLTGDTINPASELVLVDGMPSPNGNHNAGDVHVGNDGNLYVSIGDGGCDYAGNSGCAGANDAARDLHALTGKIVRISRTGGIPPGNPFTGPGTARCNTGSAPPGTRCQEIFATGLRNPFRLAFDPTTPPNVTSFRINDVGQNTWEEIDVGLAGADYGWNVREGHCANGSTTNCGAPPAGMTNPIHDYDHSGGCASITGGAFVPVGVWPSSFVGDYLFSDYVCGTIFRLEPDGAGGYVRTPFVTGLGANSAVHLGFGPFGTGPGATQALYYTTYAGGGQVRRLSHGVPVASFTTSPSSGPAPLTVTFDGSASNDPDGQPITYEWAFGDNTTSTAGPTVQHTYGAAGSYTAMLVVRDGSGNASPPTSQVINVTTSGNTPPTPTIQSAAVGATFAVAQQVTLNGRAVDAQDGKLLPGQLSWLVLLHHVPEGGTEHTHPLASGTGASLNFAYPAPEDLAAAAGSWVEAILTATDSEGASASVARRLDPVRVAVTLATTPVGFQLTLATPSDPTRTLVAPFTFTSWQGWLLTIGAPSPQNGKRFRSWSDGGVQTHTVATPGLATTYTATFGK
jgi:glucose/arabinose dehydrogenase/chitodextrinase